MKTEKIIQKMNKELEKVSKVRLENFNRQIQKDFKKIKKKYIRLLKFKEDKKWN